MLDPDPDEMNADPQPWFFFKLFVLFTYNFHSSVSMNHTDFRMQCLMIMGPQEFSLLEPSPLPRRLFGAKCSCAQVWVPLPQTRPRNTSPTWSAIGSSSATMETRYKSFMQGEDIYFNFKLVTVPVFSSIANCTKLPNLNLKSHP